jgi:hypothetical protein
VLGISILPGDPGNGAIGLLVRVSERIDANAVMRIGARVRLRDALAR